MYRLALSVTRYALSGGQHDVAATELELHRHDVPVAHSWSDLRRLCLSHCLVDSSPNKDAHTRELHRNSTQTNQPHVHLPENAFQTVQHGFPYAG